MINLPNDYDSARGFDGNGGVKLTPGGHICKIQGARVELSRNQKEMLVVAFDIMEGSEFDGYFADRYARAAKYNANAKWPGVFRANIINNEGKTNGFFKGFIEAVEASNSSYNFKATGGNEATLKGKFVGFNFGEEEFVVQNTGEVKTAVKPAYAISVAKVREGVIPPAIKRLQQTNSTPYGNAASAASSDGFVEVDDDELPF